MEPSGEPIDPLDALRMGDTGPFEGFVERQTPLFLAYFRRLGAAASDAEDLTQDVMLRLFRNAAGYRARGMPEAYAFRVARNAWIDHCRRGRTRGVGQSEEGQPQAPQVVSTDPTPDRMLEQAEQAGFLLEAIAGLGDSHREAFRLGVMEQKPYSEISTELGIPVGTVKSRVFHAVQKLRARLQEQAQELMGFADPAIEHAAGSMDNPSSGDVDSKSRGKRA